MPMIAPLIAELDQESVATRRLLARIPPSQVAWRPHAKSFSLGQLALHISAIPAGVAGMALHDTAEVPDFTQAEPADTEEILATFDRCLADARDSLGTLSDAAMEAPWTLARQGTVLMTMPRVALIRTILLNQLYHHRGQLTVYLRLLDIPLSSVYGPTADEPFF